MKSKVGWIDLSSNDLKKIRSLMDAIAGGVVDELGIGMIRDKYSNRLFTGISTLFTRAKYYFITPYILIDREIKQHSGETGIHYFHQSEIYTNKVIKEYYTKHHISNESYFGKETESGELKRQPSEVYWNGIVHLGLVNGASSLNQLLRTKRSQVEDLLSKTTDNEGTKEQGVSHMQNHVNVSYSKDWLIEIKKNGLKLIRTEAETLCSRIPQKAPHSLITALINDENLWYEFSKAIEDQEPSEDRRIPAQTNPFFRFVEQTINKILDKELRTNLIEAHDLALFLHGLHIAYNIALWETICEDDEFIDKLKDSGRQWRKCLDNRLLSRIQLKEDFDISKCIASSRPKDYTKDFLNNAYQLVFKHTSWDVFEDKLKAICKEQERRNKNVKSRFYKIEHKQTIPDMNFDSYKWIGFPLISYRYYSARSIISDIYAGLNNFNDK